MKKIVIGLLILIALPLVAAVFIPKEYAVEREIVINRPREQVFEYVKFLKNQDNFSKWASMDPHMEKTYRGTDGTVGFVSAWASDSSDVGSGEQEITALNEGERIDYELRFKEPFESTSPAYMLTEAQGENQTSVKWGFQGRMDYPMNLMLVVMDFEEMIGNDLETGLQQLKTILERPEQL